MPRTLIRTALISAILHSPSLGMELVASDPAAQTCPGWPEGFTPERANQNLRLLLREEGEGVQIDAINLRHVPMELLIKERGAENGEAQSRILPPLSTISVLQLEAMDLHRGRQQITQSMSFQSFMGDPAQIAPDVDHLYRLPFRAGKTYRLGQGFGGKQTHHSQISKYALDFQLDAGEPVHAARAGIVVRVVDWFCQSGGTEYLDYANLVIIQHDDGTLAHYVHLQQGSVLVEEGQRVERGAPLAVVGMTGFTMGPHLHFVVRRERDIAIPIIFEGYEDRDLSKPGRFRVP